MISVNCCVTEVRSKTSSSDKDSNLIPSASSPVPAHMADRFGESFEGQVHIAEKSLVRVLPYASQMELVNTAVLTGQEVSASVTVRGLFADGTVETLDSGALSCSSSSTFCSKVDEPNSAADWNTTPNTGGPSPLRT